MADDNSIEIDLTTIDGLRKIEHWAGGDDNFVPGGTLGSIAAEAAVGAGIGAVVTGSVAGVAAATGGFVTRIGLAIMGIFHKPKAEIQQIPKIPQDTQLKFAQAIIASGKKNGAKKLKITVDKDVGASVGATYVGASIKGQVGADGKFHLEVEYK
ncbi:MAG: hypothetical protein PHI97_29885 [Desulfobulbus sp.]|nr:hypothetical protein [Desulfobulbus sp.]